MEHNHQHSHDMKADTAAPYQRLLLTLMISFCVMYAVMFLNVNDASHVYLSLTRAYMSLLMIAQMAILMLLMMRNMYSSSKKNAAIGLGAGVVFCLALGLLRTQTPVHDIQYMKAMIPHHSSAILTSRHADLRDPEVKRLAQSIVQSQEAEIAEMKAAIKRLEAAD